MKKQTRQNIRQTKVRKNIYTLFENHSKSPICNMQTELPTSLKQEFSKISRNFPKAEKARESLFTF